MRNPNYGRAVQTVEELGGAVTGFRLGHKHMLVYITTPGGHNIRYALSKAALPNGEVEFFIRRAVRREDEVTSKVTSSIKR